MNTQTIPALRYRERYRTIRRMTGAQLPEFLGQSPRIEPDSCRKLLNTDHASSRGFSPLLDAWGVISVENWAEIRRLHRGEDLPIKVISRQLDISRNTVKRALASCEPPRKQRAGLIGTAETPGGGIKRVN